MTTTKNKAKINKLCTIKGSDSSTNDTVHLKTDLLWRPMRKKCDILQQSETISTISKMKTHLNWLKFTAL